MEGLQKVREGKRKIDGEGLEEEKEGRTESVRKKWKRSE